ncbi:MFS transporter [Ornithinimicrobium cerasi]|uniref:Major Facilitator Superfamily protein n=1 Tax=Ornithinimicrobium cerasi TaxID=2248773 RepID=A0A285VRD9_9MICO|nr:MFS transporter [Ornithinimicrobium cerasi]SOC56619.1 hypothetical protein SAMN05421879_10862 [Ornithinimicrobium cerasi]
MSAVQGPAARLIAAHALAATAMSLPWPLLLVLVWQGTGSTLLLGVAGAARMLPYVLCSWWAGALADRWARDRVVRVTLVLRLALLAAAWGAVAAGSLTTAVLACTLAVAVATPAYPATVAGGAGLRGWTGRHTEVVVTVEVASFVVGPAVGGLLLSLPGLVLPAAVGGTALALALMTRVGMPLASPRRAGGSSVRAAVAWWPVVRADREVRSAVGVLAVLNAGLAGAGVALLVGAHEGWSAPWADEVAYGIATAVLGFSSLGGPLLAPLGRDAAQRVRQGLALVGAGLVLAAAAPSVVWALGPLALVGAAAVHAEAAATAVLQVRVPDDVRASVLGLGDAAMIGAALLASLLAPPVARLVGGGPTLVVLAAGVLAVLVVHVLRRREPAGGRDGRELTPVREVVRPGA